MKLMTTILFILFLSLTAFGQNNDKDVELSSKFIIDLIDKVEWPDASSKDSFVINVVGDGKYVPILQSIVSSSPSNGKNITINSVSIDNKLDGCQIVFIATDSLNHLAKILKQVEKKPILTVSMFGTFARYGVMVNIREVKNSKIKYAVNKMTARKAKLIISEDLIKKAVETFG
ncbi:MAG: hypothetical protein DRP51_10540 [Candidatus Zixiibacteriota bacterium]|nr:MAG: hypothetical protein DRP51_10540 [candidate division Zixibacteria bacterium]